MQQHNSHPQPICDTSTCLYFFFCLFHFLLHSLCSEFNPVTMGSSLCSFITRITLLLSSFDIHAETDVRYTGLLSPFEQAKNAYLLQELFLCPCQGNLQKLLQDLVCFKPCLRLSVDSDIKPFTITASHCPGKTGLYIERLKNQFSTALWTPHCFLECSFFIKKCLSSLSKKFTWHFEQEKVSITGGHDSYCKQCRCYRLKFIPSPSLGNHDNHSKMAVRKHCCKIQYLMIHSLSHSHNRSCDMRTLCWHVK